MWCKFGHEALGRPRQRKPRTPPSGQSIQSFFHARMHALSHVCYIRSNQVVARECRAWGARWASGVSIDFHVRMHRVSSHCQSRHSMHAHAKTD
jgi:hypothetical protein